MDWRNYEQEILEYFQRKFPNFNIQGNASVKGRYSGVDRQIDVLISSHIIDKEILIVFDGKYFSKKIDVKKVEEFIGMLADLNAAYGVLITNKGYSEAALNRAFNDPLNIELDILNFKELGILQSLDGIIFSSDIFVSYSTPFGWVANQNVSDQVFDVSLHQRGIGLEEAVQQQNYGYVQLVQEGEVISEIVKDYRNVVVIADGHTVTKETNFIREDGIPVTIVESNLGWSNNLAGFVKLSGCYFVVVIICRDVYVEVNRTKLREILQSAARIQRPNNSYFEKRIEKYSQLMNDCQELITYRSLLVGKIQLLKLIEDEDTILKECENFFEKFGTDEFIILELIKLPSLDENIKIDLGALAIINCTKEIDTMDKIILLLTKLDPSPFIPIMDRAIDLSNDVAQKGYFQLTTGIVLLKNNETSAARKYYLDAYQSFSQLQTDEGIECRIIIKNEIVKNSWIIS